MDSVGKILYALRRQADLTQKDVAWHLSQSLRPITHQAVSKWETGDAMPNVLQFLQLCELYGVRDVQSTFNPDAQPLLNAEGRRRLREYEQLLVLSGLYAPPEAGQAPGKAPAPPRFIRLYEQPASAGTGQWLDSDACKLVPVDDSVPPGADFGVRLAGDSMEPRFANGQVVWAKQQSVLEDGQIGLFLYDGEAYCKQLRAAQDGVWLASLNPAYQPIAVEHPESLRVFGRVLG